jgi:hypothetical protein
MAANKALHPTVLPQRSGGKTAGELWLSRLTFNEAQVNQCRSMNRLRLKRMSVVSKTASNQQQPPVFEVVMQGCG